MDVSIPANPRPIDVAAMADFPGSTETMIESLNGIGPARAKELRRLGVGTLTELLDYFPRRYQFEAAECPIAHLKPNCVQVIRGTVTAVDYIVGRRPRFEATIDDSSAVCSLVWFNGAYLRPRIHPGLLLRCKARVRFFKGIAQMSQPKWEIIAEEAEPIADSKFRPIYPASERLSSEAIARIIEQNIDQALEQIDEWFEAALLRQRRLIGRREAYRRIHLPLNWDEAAQARRRIVYDELMLMQLGLILSKRLRDGRLSAPILRIDKTLDERICRRFGFALTAAQRRATFDIVSDVRSGEPMNRLLQGDVGSGKTVVALYAMLAAVANRMQAALLVPTEVLAEQHYLTLSSLLRGSAVNLELFTGRTRRQSGGKLLEGLSEGRTHIVVGTQALLQPDIEFANLGLVVADEQHRLGVRQRATLKDKGQAPHYLIMTATPIPRTLALSYFADFDVTVIDELPPGRQPIHTRWLRTDQALQAYELIRAEAAAGRQAYIVLPQIEDDGLDESRGVLREFDRLGKGPLSGLRLRMLHGQMSTEDKQRAMTEFRDGGADVLVATTVIEVGIDVPNATVMLIDQADRFGLSQLHQLRGRVGRGKRPSHCLLISDAATADAEARLQAMMKTPDGFAIAEMDLQLRGPGEFFGTRQHGLPEFKLADLSQEMALLQQAREDAAAILLRDPDLVAPTHRHLRGALARQFAGVLPLGQIG